MNDYLWITVVLLVLIFTNPLLWLEAWGHRHLRRRALEIQMMAAHSVIGEWLVECYGEMDPDHMTRDLFTFLRDHSDHPNEY